MHANRRPRVLLLIPHLGGGGAERVMELVARGLDAEKYEVHLAVVTQTQDCAKSLPARVCVHFLGARRVRGGAFRLLRLVGRLRPELILSGMFHLNFLVLLLRPSFPLGTRILVRQNGTVSAVLASGLEPWYTRWLYRLLYRNANRVICQSQSMACDLSLEMRLPLSRIAVLPNPVDIEEIRNFAGGSAELKSGSEQHLLAVGRLSREKGFDLLLEALAVVRKRFPEVSLTIAGAGPEEAALKEQTHALGLDSFVNFSGEIAQPWTLFPDATLFVLPSRDEGLPNALLEAAAGRLPIVALPASGGVADLLRGKAGVWLADEVSAEALAASLLAALKSLRPGERFAHYFIEEFCMERAIGAYEALIDRTLEEPGR